MLQLLIPIVVIGALWYLGIWPFDRNYMYLPKYADWRTKKADTPVLPKE